MTNMYINAINYSKNTKLWMDDLAVNMMNLYTPGYRESQMTFKTYLDNIMPDRPLKNLGQGKAIPGTSSENIFLEGSGYFVIKNDEGRVAYTRLGEFKFDDDGVYRASDGSMVQGYILNDAGEIMHGNKNGSENSIAAGGTMDIPTTEIKLWIDPDNGKYLGKYDEFEIKEDGVLYGKANNGNEMTPLYKIALANFHNSQELFEYKDGQFIETKESGRPVAGRGTIKSGHIELSNIDFKANATYWQQAKNQLEVSSKIFSTYDSLLDTLLQNLLQ